LIQIIENQLFKKLMHFIINQRKDNVAWRNWLFQI